MTRATWVRVSLFAWTCSLIACAASTEPPAVEKLTSAISVSGEYARRCDEVIHDDNDMPASVPPFFCEDGTVVPQIISWDLFARHNMKCDYPDRLNSECDPGSKFQVLHDDSSATIVAHCRKKVWDGHSPGDGHFGDIAVIQYSKKNGATCFYQAGPSADLFPGLDSMGHINPVPAPSNDPNHFWDDLSSQPPSCLSCHNSGPLIRSQYLAQLNQASTTKNALPEQIDFHTSTHLMHTANAPYWFPGSNFSPFHVFRVEVPGNMCMSCHRLGIAATLTNGTLDFINAGTATTFGPNSVLVPPQIPTQNNLRWDPMNPGMYLPERWMIPPGNQSPSPAEVQAANDVRDCALSQMGAAVAPPGCQVHDVTTPASVNVQLSGHGGHFCQEGAEFTVGVQNMNSPLTGTLTVDGMVKPLSTPVGQLSFGTFLPFALNGLTSKQVSVSVTDANGRSATSSINVSDGPCQLSASSIYVTQGSLGYGSLTMSGGWVNSDNGVSAQAALITHNTPGLTVQFGPPHVNCTLFTGCSASMDLIVGASVSTPAGNYTETVQATDLATNLTRTTVVNILVDACRPPPTSCAANECGTFTGCGRSLECGSCSGTDLCSYNHCCPPNTFWDSNADACAPVCNCRKGYYCDENGQCQPNSHCRPGTCQ
jgi:hypothetical protein